MENYFTKLGFRFPFLCNSADVLTDIITGNGQIYIGGDGDASATTLISRWKTEIGSSINEKCHVMTYKEQHDMDLFVMFRGASFYRQFYLKLCRSLTQQRRDLRSLTFVN